MSFTKLAVWLLRAVLFAFAIAAAVSFQPWVVCRPDHHRYQRIVFKCESPRLHDGWTMAAGFCLFLAFIFQTMETFSLLIGHRRSGFPLKCGLACLILLIASRFAFRIARFFDLFSFFSTVALLVQISVILMQYMECKRCTASDNVDEGGDVSTAYSPTVGSDQSYALLPSSFDHTGSSISVAMPHVL